MSHKTKLIVYGADVLCPSCVNLPSSKDQYEWLQAAINRKYNAEDVQYTYVDIFHPPEDEAHQAFAERVIEEDLFYPVVLIDDEVVAEGNPKLKHVYQALENRGLEPVTS